MGEFTEYIRINAKAKKERKKKRRRRKKYGPNDVQMQGMIQEGLFTPLSKAERFEGYRQGEGARIVSVLGEFWSAVIGKHMRGEHNQKKHGRRRARMRAVPSGYVSPYPGGAPQSPRRATGAKKAATVPAKRTAPGAAPAKKTAAKKTAAKKAVARRRNLTSDGLYDNTTRNIADRRLIPKINRGGTHIMYRPNGTTPLVRSPYRDPGQAYYARNAGPGRISNERLQEIFEDPSKMTAAERRMITSAGGSKALDGEDTITVQTSRGPRELHRYQVFGQIRSKIAPGSGDSTRGVTRAGITPERRAKMQEKRRESGKPSASEFGKIEKQITEDWSTDGGKTVPCVFCGKKMSPSAMSVETPKPKALGGNYKDRGGRWPSHNACNTKAGTAAQKDPIGYQEDMMKKFAKLPKDVRIRLPHVYDYFPDHLGAYPGTAAQRKKYMARGSKS